MNKLKQAARQALEALEEIAATRYPSNWCEALHDEITALREALAEQAECKECVAKQAQIDRLMLEYCPEEMTAEQTQEWGSNQRPAEQAEQEPVAQQDSDDKRLLREIFMLCEATEELEPTNDFMRGRIFEAKGIRRGIGNWYQDTFCGRSYMGEPVLNAAPVQQAEQEPVAIDWDKAHEVLCDVWSRVISADDGFDAIQDLIYAAPVRTKDLTDDEIANTLEKTLVVEDERFEFQGGRILTIRESELLLIARAVIAADREANK